MRTVTVGTGRMPLDDLLAVAAGAPVVLVDDARAAIAAGREVVDRALAAGDLVYGLTTQVGHGKDTRLSDAEIHSAQRLLVESHLGSFGPPLPAGVVRAAMTVRLNGIARGGSGAGVAVAEVLAAMLNAGVHPVVPALGSVGAGDLGQLAAVAQVAIGSGRAEYHGEIVPGAEALRRAGVAPLELGGKDGLALISANGVSVGQAALVVSRADRLAEAADLVAAHSMEALRANPSVLHPAVGRAKPIPGQIAAAEHLRALLAGGDLWRPGTARSVQDALSFRVVPQVHGALREYAAAARHAVETELNAAADNPLASTADQALVSNGNFHPMVMAIACDALRIAVAHVGQLCERRLSHLWDGVFEHLRGAVPSGPLYGLQLRYAAAARYAELRQLAAPATLDVPPLDLGVEDHATGAPLTVRRTDGALDLLEDLLAVELLLARDLLAITPERPALGRETADLLRALDDAVAGARQTPDAVHAAVRRLLTRGRAAG